MLGSCIALAIIVASIRTYYSWNTLNLEDVNNTVRNNVSEGDSTQTVHMWLSKKGWQYYHFSSVDGLDEWAGETIAEHANVDKNQIDSFTRVSLEESSWGLIWPKRIEIYFLFDKNASLIKFFCKEEQVMS